ncbi:divergent PAP2 family protein [Plectonema cf. radiosum LEGE 06105]|uniref:Divergent PAP2 family protein n=1 Tax=Plectonema cf. radiosum LEGE 06105 TaxID=945769 RepID=A0A8J7F517_9CYAN|nr:divergent PAP2 family protein [Plectonema radiosum]MBE9215372.1 divergent PAP2 family protein [Plectonema cf. radiosum LEGE 06105]
MQDIGNIFNNHVLLVALIACFVAQALKLLIELIKNGKVSVSVLVTTGGMPSAHSALVTALAAGVGQTIGWASPEFALAAIFAIIVMYDAAGVRQAAGKQARILNQVIDEMFHDHPEIAAERLKELLGHTPFQVIAGSALGVTISWLAQAAY